MKIRLAFEFDVNELNPMRRANQLYDIYEIQKFDKDLESNNLNYLQFAYFLKSNFFEFFKMKKRQTPSNWNDFETRFHPDDPEAVVPLQKLIISLRR